MYSVFATLQLKSFWVSVYVSPLKPRHLQATENQDEASDSKTLIDFPLVYSKIDCQRSMSCKSSLRYMHAYMHTHNTAREVRRHSLVYRLQCYPELRLTDVDHHTQPILDS